MLTGGGSGSDFVAGVVNRDLWTWGSFSEFGSSIARNLCFTISMFFFEGTLVANRWQGCAM